MFIFFLVCVCVNVSPSVNVVLGAISGRKYKERLVFILLMKFSLYFRPEGYMFSYFFIITFTIQLDSYIPTSMSRNIINVQIQYECKNDLIILSDIS